MDASRLASSHKQAVLAPCDWRGWLPVPTVKLFHGWDAWLPDEIQLPPTFKKKRKLKETREEDETGTQRNKDRSDFTLKQRLTQRCKGERKRKGWVQNASKTENAEVDVREWGESTPALSSKLTCFSSLSSFLLSSLPPSSESTIYGCTALTSCVLHSCVCAKRTRYSSCDSMSHHT